MLIHQITFYLNKNMKKDRKIIKLDQDPFELFAKWFLVATKNEINDPNAMNLSTVGSNLQPTSRIVLMKSFDKQGFVFNTNMKSNKSKRRKESERSIARGPGL